MKTRQLQRIDLLECLQFANIPTLYCNYIGTP